MDFLVQNANTLIWVASVISAAFGIYYAIKNDILSLKGDITHIKENQKSLAEAFTQLGNILTKVAVQDARLQMMEKKLDELAHGQGYVEIRK